MSIFHNRSARLTTRGRRRRWKMKCRRPRGGLWPTRLGPQNFCGLREREALTQPRHSSLPLDHSFMPNEDVIANFKQKSHDSGEKSGHDDERGIDFAVFGPALCPADIPAKAGF